MTDEELTTMLARHESAEFPRFAAGFADRVVARIGASGDSGVLSFERALERQTRRLLPAIAAASLMLGAWTWWSLHDQAQSPLGAVLGVSQPASVAATTSTTLIELTLTDTESFE